jgi:hypothetical protein
MSICIYVSNFFWVALPQPVVKKKNYNLVYPLMVNLESKNTYFSKPRKKKINGTFLVIPVFIICRHGGLKQN